MALCDTHVLIYCACAPQVLRDGAMAVLDASELVPGDVVEFQEGDQVPADVRVVSAYNLKVRTLCTGPQPACRASSKQYIEQRAPLAVCLGR